MRSLPKLVQGPAGFGYSDDRHVKVAAPDHLLERGENLFVSEVAGRTEKNECVRERSAFRGTAPLGNTGRQGRTHYRLSFISGGHF
jgi:hypothetical protein